MSYELSFKTQAYQNITMFLVTAFDNFKHSFL
jgi:hypothetical protein